MIVKKLPSIVDTCLKCPFLIIAHDKDLNTYVRSWEFHCRLDSRSLRPGTFSEPNPIPKSCSLPDLTREEQIVEIKKDLEKENFECKPITGHKLNDQDIVCKYIRRNKIIANL